MNDLLGGPKRPRRRRRLTPLAWTGIVLVVLGGIAALWIWVFSPIFISPVEFHAKQLAFDAAIRDVVQVRGPGGKVPSIPPWPPPLDSDRVTVLACAEAASVRGVRYAANAEAIAFPWGDVPDHIGTSADIIVRCLRKVRVDLQQLIHHDRVTDPKRYPTELFTHKSPDKAMDHRRVAYLFAFARAFLPSAPLATDKPEDAALFLPGDLVFWSIGGRDTHPGLVGVVTDRRNELGVPFVVTLVPKEDRATDDHLVDAWPILGHFSLDVTHLFERFLETYPGLSYATEPPPAPRQP